MDEWRVNYGKRSHSQVDCVDKWQSKRTKLSDDTALCASGLEYTVYRYLCPAKKIGRIIGKGGESIKQMRADSNANIRIDEAPLDCEERVIIIYSLSKETGMLDDIVDYVCAAQDALFRVHEKFVKLERSRYEDAEIGAPRVTVRLLIPSDQVRRVIGKGGQTIQRIRGDTGAQIRISGNGNLPQCAIKGDELLQINGEATVVQKALFQVSSCLHDNPSRSQHLLISDMSHAYSQTSQYGGPNAGYPAMDTGPLGSYGRREGDAVGDWLTSHPSRDGRSAKEFGLHLICPSVNIGEVIGKGGVFIKQIRQESGAFIKIDSSYTEDDCIISVSAEEYFAEPVSPTINAAVRLQPKCSKKIERESAEPSYTTRLLVPASQIGRLIGKGGAVISEIRRATRAHIRVLSKENVPSVVSDDEYMVQISGDPEVAQNALKQVMTQLRANFFRWGSASSSSASADHDPVASNTSDGSKYGRRVSREHGCQYFSYSSGYSVSSDMSASKL